MLNDIRPVSKNKIKKKEEVKEKEEKMANEPLAKTVLDSNSQAEDSLILQNKTISGSPLFECEV